MKDRRVNYRRMIICILAILPLLAVACKGGTTGINPSPTDVVTITDVNAFISEGDLKAGVKKTNNEVPPVIFSHSIHEKAGLQCVTCHHKEGNDERIKQCAMCHKGTAGDETMHNLCINCHLERKAGPAQCQDCHHTGPDAH